MPPRLSAINPRQGRRQAAQDVLREASRLLASDHEIEGCIVILTRKSNDPTVISAGDMRNVHARSHILARTHLATLLADS